MLEAGDPIERREERAPDPTLAGEYLPSGRRQPVKSPAPGAGTLDPAAFDQALVLQPVQNRIKGGDMKVNSALGAFLDEAADLVAVPLPFLEQRQDQQFRAATLQLSR